MATYSGYTLISKLDPSVIFTSRFVEVCWSRGGDITPGWSLSSNVRPLGWLSMPISTGVRPSCSLYSWFSIYMFSICRIFLRRPLLTAIYGLAYYYLVLIRFLDRDLLEALRLCWPPLVFLLVENLSFKAAIYGFGVRLPEFWIDIPPY